MLKDIILRQLGHAFDKLSIRSFPPPPREGFGFSGKAIDKKKRNDLLIKGRNA